MGEAAPLAPAHHPALTPGTALRVLAGIVLALAGYLGTAAVLHIGAPVFGVLVVFYWFSIKRGDMAALPGAATGALGGVVNTMLFALPGVPPEVAALVAIAVLAAALYALLVGFWPMLFNSAYMLVVTVATIPAVLARLDPAGMVAAIALSAAYFGGLAWVVRRYRARRART